MKRIETIVGKEIHYTEWDQILWKEDLEEFVPEKIFDAHAHLWIDDHLPADHPRRNLLVQSNMRVTEDWNRRLFPGRKMEYLMLGTPIPGVDVAAHNRFLAQEM